MPHRLRSAAAAAALFLIAATATAQPVTDPAIRTGIDEIIARMNHALDAEDYDSYMTVWHPDATFQVTGQDPIAGADGVLTYLRAGQAMGYITGKRHAVTNLTLDHDGDIVRARYYLAVYERATLPALIATAVITDDFVRDGDTWRIVRHVTDIDPAMFNAMAAVPRQ